MKPVSVIIPCYNEKERIFPVIEEILKSDLVREIIVVDDGSDKKTKNLLKLLPDSVLIVRHKKNKGKSAAMESGLKTAKSSIVVFIDADLRKFTKTHLRLLCNPVLSKECDMVIGVREKDVLYSRIVSFSAAYGGERAFKRKTLMRNTFLFKSGGYMIEAEMNKHFLREGRVKKVFMAGVGQTSKIEKNGLLGFGKCFQMAFEIISRIGLDEFRFQVSSINKMSFHV